MKCIFCGNEAIDSLEHIVPESLGNDSYTIRDIICIKCNNRFSKFEQKAVSNTYLAFIRIMNGIKTKKGKPGTLNLNAIKGTGKPDFARNVIKFENFGEFEILDYNPADGSYKISIPDFHKSEMATAKLLLKMAIESLYKSKKGIFQKHDFSQAIKCLIGKNSNDWMFITSHICQYSFKSIPTHTDKYNLCRIKCELGYIEISEEIFLFNFCYDYFHLTINLLHRTLSSWTDVYYQNDTSTSMYPRYLKHKSVTLAEALID